MLGPDRRGIDLVARVPRGIPKHEWSLDLGDALHNLRSAFDAVAWGMADFDDRKPTRPKRVAFPICDDEKQWDEAVKAWVGEIHPELQERLRLMQPFTYVPDGGVSVLSMLHGLDIQDKHHDILSVTADLHGVDLAGSFEDEESGAHAVPRVEARPDVKFGDGVVLATIHAGAPIRLVGQMILRPGRADRSRTCRPPRSSQPRPRRVLRRSRLRRARRTRSRRRASRRTEGRELRLASPQRAV